MSRPPSVPACFAARAALAPGAVAVEHGDHRLTYAELDHRSDRLAGLLVAGGTRPEEPVAVAMAPGPGLPVALLAVLKAGACYLPVHGTHPVERTEAVLQRAGCRRLLTDTPTRRRGLPAGPEVVLVDTATGVLEDDHGVAAATGPTPWSATGPDDLAYVMHTSGSSGEPKGVAVTHRGVLGLALDRIFAGGAHDRVLMLAPSAFGVSTYEIWVPLLRGGTVVVPSTASVDVHTLRTAVAEGGITALHLTAGLFRVVAEDAPDCLAGLREVLTGGDVIAPKAVQAVLQACPGLVVRAMYGATEVSSFATSSPMTAPWTPRRTVPVGRPMDGVVLEVLDADGVAVAPGEVGELHIGGDRLARGYLHRPDLTAERFVEGPGGRRYRTGDLVRFTEDGLVDFVGRATDLVKIRGYRVEPAEVEAVLAGCPGVAHVTVVARPDDLDGHRLTAYVVPEAGASVDTAALLEHAATRLPDYMLPGLVVALPVLPLTPHGKVDRAALPVPAAVGAAGAGGERGEPVSERQRRLCALFGDVLGVPGVGTDDSFFDLDGQSLLAVRLLHRIDAELDVRLTVADLFNAPTVAELDAVISRRDAA
ncbi:MAG: Polyketide synthase modules and related proteins [uncultured Pseudonocardia sp.]|uniref:Polyketide synthase modules and related proteins n=1 Tax=uncultured Pseudonocardia sp. TaxID=211455 RepID=A0A6J4PCI2_9PSEU|nr:MAG: Polyketide synthase modules and related proteins [uncultured Pseudonocardia sp.]